jgi:2,4-dienoyl-CoA reductase-like NADH-dependent reductase (Old Yellow Enzyme family)
MAVGLILEAAQAEAALESGQADLVAIGREFLRNPNWALEAATALMGERGYRHWPANWAWWLQRRRID